MIKNKKFTIQLAAITSATFVATIGTMAVIFLGGGDVMVVGAESGDKAETNTAVKKKDEVKVKESETKEEAGKKEDNPEKKEEAPKAPETIEFTDDNGDNITVSEEIREEEISYGAETRQEVNLPRGEVSVAQNGVTGIRQIVHRLTYKNGVLVSDEEVSSSIAREPENQINLVGVSDYNLNSSYIQLYPNASVSREDRSAPAVMILVDGNYYVNFWYDPITWEGYAPATALSVGGNSFSYNGLSYQYALGSLDSNYPLTDVFCNRYGLACGRW